MWMDEIIASVDLNTANGGTSYVINYIDFSPNIGGYLTGEERER